MTVRERLAHLVRARMIGFTTALFVSAAFPLVLLAAGDAKMNCFAHWSYGVGEAIALLAVLGVGLRQFPATTALHAGLTLGWVYLVSRNCAVWLALWTATGLPGAHHPM